MTAPRRLTIHGKLTQRVPDRMGMDRITIGAFMLYVPERLLPVLDTLNYGDDVEATRHGDVVVALSKKQNIQEPEIARSRSRQDRYYIQQNQVDGNWELWERLSQGEHKMLAEFLDGDDNGSPLAEKVLADLLLETRRIYIPLVEEELHAILAMWRQEQEVPDET